MFIYRTLSILVAAIVLSISCYAQPVYTFYFDAIPKSAQPGLYSKLKVIDARVDKEKIGLMQTGALNRKRPLVPEKNLTELLPEVYNKMQPGNKGSDELVMVLHHFMIEDRPNGDEMGTFFIDADFFGGKEEQYQYITTVHSIYEVLSGLDVTEKLLDTAQVKIYGILSNVAARPAMDSSAIYTMDQATGKRQNDKLKFPIYNSPFQKGIYYTVDQFINNTPVDTPFKVVEYHPNGGALQVFIYRLNHKGKRGDRIEEKDFFAVYDGKEWYVSGYGHSYRMKYEQGDFYARCVFSGINSASVTGASMMFGLVGGLIAGATHGGKEVKVLYRAVFDPSIKDFRPVSRH